MKFEQHLINKYPEKYKDYELSFTGTLTKMCLDRRTFIHYFFFERVNFPQKKLWSKKKNWIIDVVDITDIYEINEIPDV